MKATLTTLLPFLRSGHLGELRLRMPREQVAKLLGSARMKGGDQLYQIWKYGSLQVAFDDGTVFAIGLYFRGRRLVIPKRLGLTLASLPCPLATPFERFLRAHDIGFRLYDALTFDDQKCLLLSCGVHAIFDTRSQLLDQLSIGWK
jgi:hypothetical protein